MNKMFKKLMAVSATVAIAATMSVSAFAAGETATHTDGSVKVENYAAVTGATQYTVMLFLDSEDGISADEIYYINQGSKLYADENAEVKDGLLDQMLVKATNGVNALPDGDYTIRIGNDAGIVTDVDLKVTTVVTPTGKDVTFIWGDINLDGYVDASDITALAMRTAGGQLTYEGKSNDVAFTFTIDETSYDILWGDINVDGYVDASDITALAMRTAGGQLTFGDYTIDENVTITIPVVNN